MKKVIVMMDAEEAQELITLDPDTAGELYVQLSHVQQYIIKYGFDNNYSWKERVDTILQLGKLLGKLELCQLTMEEFALVLAIIEQLQQ